MVVALIALLVVGLLIAAYFWYSSLVKAAQRAIANAVASCKVATKSGLDADYDTAVADIALAKTAVDKAAEADTTPGSLEISDLRKAFNGIPCGYYAADQAAVKAVANAVAACNAANTTKNNIDVNKAVVAIKAARSTVDVALMNLRNNNVDVPASLTAANAALNEAPCRALMPVVRIMSKTCSTDPNTLLNADYDPDCARQLWLNSGCTLKGEGVTLDTNFNNGGNLVAGPVSFYTTGTIKVLAHVKPQFNSWYGFATGTGGLAFDTAHQAGCVGAP